MDIRRWKVMLAVSDAGSYTRAAEELGLTQSAVTQMMKALEKEVFLIRKKRTGHETYPRGPVPPSFCTRTFER